MLYSEFSLFLFSPCVCLCCTTDQAGQVIVSLSDLSLTLIAASQVG